MNKAEEKKHHVEELEKNELMEWGKRFWSRLKAGEVVSQKFVLLALAIGAAIGLWLYLRSGAKSGDLAAWKALEATSSAEGYDELSKAAPDSATGRVARLQKARLLLGPQGLTPLQSAINPDTRSKALKSIEEAREIFGKLADEFKNDLTLTAQALDGAAQAELALVGVPKEGTKPGDASYRGSVDKVVELYEKYAKLVGDDNPAGAAAKKKAKDLSEKKQEVLQLSAFIYQKREPEQGEAIKAPPSLTPPTVPNVPALPPAVIPEAPKK
ncbi:hypothetical protein BH11PLA2_BH11PLA2_33870 [soil metagenome]